MQQKVLELELGENIECVGYKDDIKPYLQEIDVLIHATRTPEPFGLIIIEGMASGKAVLATRGGGPDDIIHDMEDGILIEPENPLDMAEKLMFLYSNPEKMHQLKLNGRNRANDFSVSKYAKKLKNYYLDVVLKKGN